MKDDPLYLINVDNSIDGWWPSDTRVQDIWSQSTDLDCLEYSSFSTWSVNIFNFLQHCECQVWSKVYLCQCCTIIPSYNTGPWTPLVNTLRPRQNGRHFTDDTFKRISLNENITISIKISLKFVPKGPINNIPVLVQIMAWRRPGDKPLSEPMMIRLPTHICVIRPQWVK